MLSRQMRILGPALALLIAVAFALLGVRDRVDTEQTPTNPRPTTTLAVAAGALEVTPTAAPPRVGLTAVPTTPASGERPTPTAPRIGTNAAPTTPAAGSRPTLTPTSRGQAAQPTPNDGLPTIDFARLPPEARETIRLIDQGGPFPFDRDGITFGNRERLLPIRPGDYYSEYTVITPGSDDRGARRIIAGAGGELYYTDDHYESFRRVRR